MRDNRWKMYFEFSPCENRRVNGLCKLCNRNYKDKINVFSNFLKHLKRMHIREYNQIFVEEDQGSPADSNSRMDDAEGSDVVSSKCEQHQWNTSIAKNLVVKCNLPLTLVQNPAFCNFMKDLNPKWQPISSEALKSNLIPAFVNDVRTTIRKTLVSLTDITITVNAWADRRCRSFLGLTAHFIDKNFNPQVFLIDFVRFKSSNTGANIQQATEDVLDRFGLKEKVFRILTDNASTVIKAYQFGLSVDEEIRPMDVQPQLIPDESTIFGDEEEDFDVDEFRSMDIQEEEGREEGSEHRSMRLSCFAHSMQLCIRDGLRKVPHVPKVLTKCQVLAKAAHKSSKVADVLEALNKHINKENLTRWNSEYLLCKSILSVGKKDLELVSTAMENPVEFSVNDLIVLKEIVNILDPFYEISIQCQSKLAVSASLVVPSISHLLLHLSEMKGNVRLCLKLIDQLQTSIETRFAGIVNRLKQRPVQIDDPYKDSLFFMATVLDPQFKFYWLRDMKVAASVENQLKQTIIQLIIDEISKDGNAASSQVSETRQSSTTATPFSTSTTGQKRRKLFHYTKNIDGVRELDPNVEMQAYLDDPVKSRFPEYWFHSQLPLLKKIVTRIFSVQASSAPVERVFSYAGMILSPRRTNTSEKLFTDLVFLKANQTLL